MGVTTQRPRYGVSSCVGLSAARPCLSPVHENAHTVAHCDGQPTEGALIHVCESPDQAISVTVVRCHACTSRRNAGLTALLALNALSALPRDFFTRVCPSSIDATSPRTPVAASTGWCHPLSPTLYGDREGATGTAIPLAGVEHNGAQHLHALIECLRLAFADTRHYFSDPKLAELPVAALLSPGYSQERVRALLPHVAVADHKAGSPALSSDTVSFQVVDSYGNACSFINSNYMGFGTALRAVASACRIGERTSRCRLTTTTHWHRVNARSIPLSLGWRHGRTTTRFSPRFRSWGASCNRRGTCRCVL